MTTTIYYFSGTGNSLKVARDLAEQIEDCELVPMARLWQRQRIVAEVDRAGFVFPLYFYGLPNIVLKFVEKIDLKKCSYLFVVITRGGSPGCAIHKMQNLLKDKGKTLDAGFKVNMPGNYIPTYNIWSQQKQRKMFKKASEKVAYIAEVIRNNQREIKRDSIFFWPISTLINNRWLRGVSSKDEKFYADDNCTSCGICEKICPVDNIKLSEDRPRWQHRCQRCLACIHFCPEQAIQYGKKTAKRKRYHHPDIKMKDIANQKSLTGEQG